MSVGKGAKIPIFGSKAISGELNSTSKYQIIRNDEIIEDDLTLSNLKHHKKNVSSIEKGMECGISFNSKRGQVLDFKKGDVIECYEEVELDELAFSTKGGLVKTF